MDLHGSTIYGITLLDWVIAVGIGLAVALAARVLKAALLRWLGGLAERTVTDIDDLLVLVIRRTGFFLYVFLFLSAALLPLTLPASLGAGMRHLAMIALLLQVGQWGNGVIDFAMERYRKRASERDPASTTMLTFLKLIGRLALWSILLLVGLDNLGVDVTTLVASLGIGGLAIALALQNILGDLFASVSILLDKPFVVGDFIIVGDFLGVVEKIGIKTTRIRSLSGEQLVFSNNDLLASRIRNYKRMYERRVVFSVGVTYQTPHDQLARIPAMIREIIEAQQKIRFDRAHFKEYGDSSLVFEIVYYVLAPDYNLYMDIQQAINLAIYEQFAAAGIDFAYPTRTLYLAKEEGANATEALGGESSTAAPQPRATP